MLTKARLVLTKTKRGGAGAESVLENGSTANLNACISKEHNLIKITV